MGRGKKRHRELQLQAFPSPSEHILEMLLFGAKQMLGVGWEGVGSGAGRAEPLSSCSCDVHQNGSRRAVKGSPCPWREGLIYCTAGSDSFGALWSFQSGPFSGSRLRSCCSITLCWMCHGSGFLPMDVCGPASHSQALSIPLSRGRDGAEHCPASVSLGQRESDPQPE